MFNSLGKILVLNVVLVFLCGLSGKAQYNGGNGDGFDVIEISGAQVGIGTKQKSISSIHPNPAKTGDILTIEPFQKNLYSLFEIVNEEGKLYKTGQLSGNKPIRISLQEFLPGKYFLVVKELNETYTLVIK